jgi:hypothetical protein
LLDSRSNNKRCPREIPIDLVCVTLLIGYFLYFALQRWPARFRGDDLANMHDYWSAWAAGPLDMIRANVGRPLGALYYLPLHALFDLNPKPYRIATVALVGAAIPVAYSLGRLLGGSRSLAFLAVFAWCYHPRLANLVFVDAFIYDVLCSLFYLAALLCYVGVRERERCFQPLQLFSFFALYICALNSKEMAVTVPIIVLLYELLKYYHESERESVFQWVRHKAWPALVAGLIAGVYCYEKIYGRYGISRFGAYTAYTPHYSWAAFTTSNARFVSQFFFLFPNHSITGGMLLAVWALVFVYAFLRRDRMLQLMAVWIVITPLPLAFVPPRGGASLIIILFGWAMIFAKLVSDLSLLVVRLPLLRKLPALRVRVAVMLLVAMLLGLYVGRQNRFLLPLLHLGEKEAHVIEAFRVLNLHPRPRSNILLTNNPFTGAPGRTDRIPLFIAKLLWNDHSLKVYLQGKDILSSEETAGMDYILAVHEYKVEVIREPH